MRYRKEAKWTNWFAWYPVYLKETNESIWLEWTHRYPEYFENHLLSYYYRPGKINERS